MPGRCADGDNVLASYDSGGTLNAGYLTPGLDANLAMTQGENTYYYMQDGLGSVRTIVDSSENVTNWYDYRAFGVNHGMTENVTSPYHFTAREFETGGVLNLHYYRNRSYAPSLGIFTSRDAMWADVHRGWGYVGNNPVNLLDPYGLGFWEGFFEGLRDGSLGICRSSVGVFDWLNDLFGIDDTQTLTRNFDKAVEDLIGGGITDSDEYSMGELGGYGAWAFGSGAALGEIAGLGNMSIGELATWWKGPRKGYIRLDRTPFWHINIQPHGGGTAPNYHIPLNLFRWGQK